MALPDEWSGWCALYKARMTTGVILGIGCLAALAQGSATLDEFWLSSGLQRQPRRQGRFLPVESIWSSAGSQGLSTGPKRISESDYYSGIQSGGDLDETGR